MTSLVLSALLSLVAFPLLALYWVTRPSTCRLLWAFKALAVGSYLLATYYIGAWYMLSIYGRYALGALFVVAVLYGGRQMRRRIVWRTPNGWQWAQPILSSLLLLVGIWGLVTVYQAQEVPDAPVDLAFPLQNGEYYVASGGSHALLNPHLKVGTPQYRRWRGQQWGLDVVELYDTGNRARGLYPSNLQQYAIFGVPVYAPCAGSVVETESNLADLSPPARDTTNKAGNYVMVRCASDAYVLLAHFQQHSVRVEAGDTVTVDTRLGAVGNSGNSWEPHLHVSAQHSEGGSTLLDANPRPITFRGRYLLRNAIYQRSTD